MERFSHVPVWLPKHGNAPSEYEDAYSIGEVRTEVSQRFEQQCFAVADGATESSFAQIWAHSLVEHYVRQPFTAMSLVDDVKALQQNWCDVVGSKALPWFAQEKAAEGAYAAFIGLTMERRNGERTWRAVAIGDSCLFHVRGKELLKVFPIQRSDEFNNRPLLLSSRGDRNAQLWDEVNGVREANGHWQKGDAFLLMSDALACWCLRSVERSDKHWRQLLQLPKVEVAKGKGKGLVEFEQMVGEMREMDGLRNDDVTLIIVRALKG